MILLLGYVETSKIILSLRRMQFNIIVLTNRYPNSEAYKLQHYRRSVDVTVKNVHTVSETK